MESIKQLKKMDKLAGQQQQVILELNALVKDIERCERTIVLLKQELQAITAKYQGQRNTREDIEYLTELLKCAKKKLAWEKTMASLQKRTPSLLERMSSVVNDPAAPPDEQSRVAIVGALQSVQQAMERLDKVKKT